VGVGATTVFLVRHAAHERVDRILCGRMPGVSLGETGWAQAAQVAKRLSREQLAGIYSTVSPALNEIDLGNWTGRSFAELDPDPQWQAWNAERAAGEAPGGERMQAVQDRVVRELENLRCRHQGQRVAAVSHADVIKAAICGVLGLSLDRYHAFEIEPASISSLVLWHGGGKVLRLNELCAA
jgi:probable phosphoglycerate mutase